MQYTIELKPKSVKDLKSIPLSDRKKIIERIDLLKDKLSGDVKKLTNHTPEYRMRCGNYRVLFEVDGEKVIIYRVLHRKEVYKK